jgi:hypothetical protein
LGGDVDGRRRKETPARWDLPIGKRRLLFAANGSGGNVSSMLFQQQNVPLGIHTVTLQPTGPRTRRVRDSGQLGCVEGDAIDAFTLQLRADPDHGARSGPAPVLLLDVVALDGTSYHWGNKEIDVAPVYPTTLPGTPPAAWLAGLANPPADYDTHYFPWLLSASWLQPNARACRP